MKRKKKSKFNWDRITLNLILSGFVILLVLQFINFCVDIKQIQIDNQLKESIYTTRKVMLQSQELRDEIMFENDLRHTKQILELYGICGEK